MNEITLNDVRLETLAPHEDDRGRFVEIFRQRAFPVRFEQANHSRSRGGVLRGMHFHRRQADLWYVARGRAQVALADLRDRGRRQIQVIELNGDRPSSLYIPPGVAHGFLALDDLDLIYAVTSEYDESDEFGIAWDDATLSIPWATKAPLLSVRDANNPGLSWHQLPEF